jgi:hypothetical protein
MRATATTVADDATTDDHVVRRPGVGDDQRCAPAAARRHGDPENARGQSTRDAAARQRSAQLRDIRAQRRGSGDVDTAQPRGVARRESRCTASLECAHDGAPARRGRSGRRRWPADSSRGRACGDVSTSRRRTSGGNTHRDRQRDRGDAEHDGPHLASRVWRVDDTGDRHVRGQCQRLRGAYVEECGGEVRCSATRAQHPEQAVVTAGAERFRRQPDQRCDIVSLAAVTTADGQERPTVRCHDDVRDVHGAVSRSGGMQGGEAAGERDDERDHLARRQPAPTRQQRPQRHRRHVRPQRCVHRPIPAGRDASPRRPSTGRRRTLEG